MDIAMNDFEYERRFFCRALPPELDDGEPMLIVQSYYVHDGSPHGSARMDGASTYLAARTPRWSSPRRSVADP